jgi:mRNA interferase MazF
MSNSGMPRQPMVSMKRIDVPKHQRGQIWWVTHDPAMGSEPAMTRPSIIVSNPDHNEFMPTVTVCPLTSSVRRIYDFEVFVLEGDGGIPKDSKVQPQLVRTISKERLLDYIGQASAETLELVDEALKLHFGFA